MEYKSGDIVGVSFDTDSPTSSAHVFMIKSVLSKYKDVVYLLPVKTLTGEVLHMWLKKVIICLEKIGFNVLCVITDNNGINRKALSQFSSPPKLQFVYPHPANKNKPLFFIFDSVHLLKCVRNNWLNQKNSGKCFFYPNFEEGFNIDNPHNFKTASLNTLRRLYDIECNLLVKFGFKLSHKALYPSSIERQNVNLVLRVFNEFVVQGLIQLGDKYKLPYFQDTADFMKLILKWWQILNVKYAVKGIRLNSNFQTPLKYDESDDKLIFLHKFANWLEEWEKMVSTPGMFTNETHTALKLTILGIIEITRYCKDELHISYILTDKFQTDDLESRFGLYRQLAGSQYHISLQQLFECEKKIRVQLVLHLQIPSKAFGEIKIVDFDVLDFMDHDVDCKNFSDISVDDSDLDEVDSYMPVFIYITGYCIHKVLKREYCESCSENHLCNKKLQFNVNYDLVKNLDRGQLMFPKEYIVNVVLYNYVVVNKLCCDFKSEFLKMNDHRKIVSSITMSILDDNDMLSEETCENFHYTSTIFKKVVWMSSNIFLNNFCKKCNDDIVTPRFKKRNAKKKNENNNSDQRKLNKFTGF